MPKPAYDDSRTEIVDKLFAARQERNVESATRLLTQVVHLAKQWQKNSSLTEATCFRINALTELALLQTSRESRKKIWYDALSDHGMQWDASSADAVAGAAVDYSQDSALTGDNFDRPQVLRKALRIIDGVLKVLPKNERGGLLARKSSVQRHLVTFEPTRRAQLDLAEESLRCAYAGLGLSPLPGTVVEVAAAEWTVARFTKSDTQYAQHLRKATELLSSPDLADFEQAQFASAAIQRYTFQPLAACVSYPRRLGAQRHLRRLLRESYIYGEAATQLWYRDFPDPVIAEHLGTSIELLEGALLAGYNTARIISDLAFCRAASGNTEGGMSDLAGLVTAQGLKWTDIPSAIRNSAPDDLAFNSFALGLNNSSVLTRLGTFGWRFLQNSEVAEGLYRAAVRINSYDAVAHTNLARFLLEEKPQDRAEIGKLLERAASIAEPRFTWWRQVRARFGGAQTPLKVERVVKPAARGKSLSELTKEYYRVRNSTNPQARGYELERLIQELAELTFGKALPPYRYNRSAGDKGQVDGFIWHGSDRYRVECKWTSQAVTRDTVTIFHGKLDVAGLSGLLISIMGFDDSAKAAAKQYSASHAIILMDGDEVESLFEGWVNLDMVLSEKRSHLDVLSEPYHKVVVAEQD